GSRERCGRRPTRGESVSALVSATAATGAGPGGGRTGVFTRRTITASMATASVCMARRSRPTNRSPASSAAAIARNSACLPLSPGWRSWVCAPFCQPLCVPPALLSPPAEALPPPAPFLDKPAALEVEVRLPTPDAKLFIDGVEVKSTGAVRNFATPELPTAQFFTYDLRAEWKTDGLTTTHLKKVTGRAGEKLVVDFTK